jgi:hypothetical protein
MKNNLAGSTGSLALHRDPLAWGGSSFPSYEGRLEDPPSSAAAPASPAPASSPAASPAAPAAPAASPTAPSATAPVDWKSAPAQLRQAYETTKAEHDKYLAIGKPDEVQAQVQQLQTIRTQTFDLGKKMGFSDAEIGEAFARKPVETLLWLRQQAAQGRQPAAPGAAPQGPQDLEKMIDERLSPVTTYLNQQATEAANSRFETEFTRIFNEAFPEGENDVKEFLFDFTSELMKYDQEALLRLKKEGKVSDVQKYFKTASDRLTNVFTKWQGYQQKRAGQKPGGVPQAAAPAGPGYTLQDVIEGNENAIKNIPSMRR